MTKQKKASVISLIVKNREIISTITNSDSKVKIFPGNKKNKRESYEKII